MDAASLNVSRETFSKLEALAAEVLRWQKAINLIAPATIPDLWPRHIQDSLQLLPYVPTAKPIYDLGSGGGFPGLVLACAAQEFELGPITMIESDQRKCQFLAQTARKLGLSQAKVITSRIEAHQGDPAPLITARALAPLPKLMNWALPLLADQGTMLFLKGANHEQEVAEARQSFAFDLATHPSQTSADARILALSNIKRLT